MWNKSIKPHGEYFSKNQRLIFGVYEGNQRRNIPMRLDNSQGGTSIRMVASKDSLVTIGEDNAVLLKVYGTTEYIQGEWSSWTDEEGLQHGTYEDLSEYYYLGMSRREGFPPSGSNMERFPEGALIVEFVLPPTTFDYPYIKIESGGDMNEVIAGYYDIIPHYISHPRR